MSTDQIEEELRDEEVDVVDIDPREYQMNDETETYVPVESALEVFKRHIVQVFDVDPELVESLQVREGLEFRIDEVPTRRERMGYSWVPTAEDRKRQKSVPKWAREVQCPKCGAIMTPLKSKFDTKFGENVTYQCHRLNEYREMCLTLVQLTTGVYYMMRPGDFVKSDWDWRKVAPETVPMIPGMRPVEMNPETDFVKPVEVPPNPWDKSVQGKVIWDIFWALIMETGECGYDELKQKVVEKRPQDGRPGKFRNKLDRELDSLPSWMQRRTGYVVKQFGRVYRVVGKSRGDFSAYPFSQADYRKVHGF